MENASKALIIGGTILIAIIVLSVGVYLITSYSAVGESYEKTQGDLEINKFNTNFTKFKDRTNITAQEIITLKNFAKNYKEQNPGIEITVKYPNDGIIMLDAEYIKKYATDDDGKIKYFKVKEEGIKYDESTGRIKEIEFINS